MSDPNTLVPVAEEIAAAVCRLARHRVEAVLLWDPGVAIHGGVVLDARVTPQLILAIFAPDSTNPLNRGIMVLRGNRVERAAVNLDWRAVLRSERGLEGALAVEVDEPSGRIHIMDRRGRVENVDETALVQILRAHALASH